MDGIRTEHSKVVQIVELLAETVGIRAAARLARVDQQTVLRILETVGEHCARLLDSKIHNIKTALVQADEVFSWVQQKPNYENRDDPNRGEIWTFMSIARDEKLIINWRVSKRTGDDAAEFLTDLKHRTEGRFQFVTDSFRGYVAAQGPHGSVETILGDVCDYATETKRIKKDPTYTGQRAFFAPKKVEVKRASRFGSPDLSVATTNHAERTNLSLRTFNRRFVRCTLNFSKKTENHRHAVALFIAHFNFCRVHKSLDGKTPAMAAGLTDHVWTVSELILDSIPPEPTMGCQSNRHSV